MGGELGVLSYYEPPDGLRSTDFPGTAWGRAAGHMRKVLTFSQMFCPLPTLLTHQSSYTSPTGSPSPFAGQCFQKCLLHWIPPFVSVPQTPPPQDPRHLRGSSLFSFPVCRLVFPTLPQLSPCTATAFLVCEASLSAPLRVPVAVRHRATSAVGLVCPCTSGKLRLHTSVTSKTFPEYPGRAL